MKKDDIIFGLYVTVAVATTANAAVNIYKTFKKEKKETAPKTTEKTN